MTRGIDSIRSLKWRETESIVFDTGSYKKVKVLVTRPEECDNGLSALKNVKRSPLRKMTRKLMIMIMITINKIGLLLCHSHIELRLWLRLT